MVELQVHADLLMDIGHVGEQMEVDIPNDYESMDIDPVNHYVIEAMEVEEYDEELSVQQLIERFIALSMR